MQERAWEGVSSHQGKGLYQEKARIETYVLLLDDVRPRGARDWTEWVEALADACLASVRF